MPSSLFTLHSSRGFAQVILLLFLLAGIGIGTYIVQNRTSFLPRADCNPGIDNNCDTGGGSEDNAQAEKEAQQKQEQQDLEKGAREAGKSVEEYKVDDCKANPGKSGCDEILKKATTTSDGQSFDTQSDETKRRFSATYCNGDPNANCAAAKAQWAKEHAVDVANGGKARTEEQRLAEEKEAADRNKATLDASRKSLDPDGIYKNEGADAYVAKCLESGKPQEECDNRKKLLEEIIKAQQAHDYAVATKFDNPVTQTAAYGQAKLLARAANCDAVAAGIPGSNCVLDMGDTTNIQTAKVCPDNKASCEETEKVKVRIFLGCSTTDFNEQGSCRKVLNYRPEGCSIQNDNLTKPECKPKELPEDAAKALGIADPRNVYNIADLPPAVLQSGVDYCQATGGACILAGQSSTQTIPAGQPGSTEASAACTDPEIRKYAREKSLSQGCSSCLQQEKYKVSYNNLRRDLGPRATGCSDSDLLNFYANDPYGGREFEIRTKGQPGNPECSAFCGANPFNTSSTQTASADAYGSTAASSSCQASSQKVSKTYSWRSLTASCSKCLVEKFKVNQKVSADLTTEATGCSPNDLANFYANDYTNGKDSSEEAQKEFKIRTQGGTADGNDCKASCGTNTFNLHNSSNIPDGSFIRKCTSTGQETKYCASIGMNDCHVLSDAKNTSHERGQCRYADNQNNCGPKDTQDCSSQGKSCEISIKRYGKTCK